MGWGPGPLEIKNFVILQHDKLPKDTIQNILDSSLIFIFIFFFLKKTIVMGSGHDHGFETDVPV